MRSNTYTSLLEFINWWGIDPWRAAGIDLTGEIPVQNKKSDTKNCYCMLQHRWDSRDQYSRDDLIEMLKFGEQVFIDEAGFYPVPTQILEERKQYNSRDGLRQKDTYKFRSVNLDYSFKLEDFGTRYLESIYTIVLTRDDIGDGTGNIMLDFNGSFPHNNITDTDKYKMYFTMADGRNVTVPNIEDDREWEIRPIKFKVDGNNIVFEAPAYLFKKPELDEVTECLLHEFDTYVTEVEIFLILVDKCSQGYFVCDNQPCSGYNCENYNHSICVNKRFVGNSYYAVPYPSECNDNSQLVNYCLNCYPHEVVFNYISGQNTKNNLVELNTITAIHLLSISLYGCVDKKQWCVCDVCASAKVAYYREPELIKVENAARQSSLGDRFVHYITPRTKGYIKGLPPYRGLAEAFTIISRIGNKEIDGTIL